MDCKCNQSNYFGNNKYDLLVNYQEEQYISLLSRT